MKKALSLLIAISFILSCFGGLNAMAEEKAVSTEPSAEKMLSNGISPITGTFIQPWLYNNYSEERWDEEMQLMKKLGIEYIIMGDTLSCVVGSPITDTSKWQITAHYKSKVFNTDSDCLTKIFEKCKEYGIKLYVGMGNTPAGWSFLDQAATGFVQISEMFAEVAEDLYNVYYNAYPETFAGFYFVPELYNSSSFDSEYGRSIYVKNLSKGFKIIFNKLNELNPSLPFIFSPYVNMFGGSWVSKSTENIGLFWKELLANAGFRNGDILCPQDSIGAGGNDLENLEAVTKAYKYAVDNCGLDIRLWSNCEIFVQPTGKFYDNFDGYGNYWSSCTIDRMVEQFKIVSKYVDRIFCFAVPHYLSPYNTVDGYYDAYMYYLENGELDTEKPIAPTRFRTMMISTSQGKALQIYWSGMYDNVGVHRVNIYKNGELLTYRVPTRNEGTSEEPVYPNSFYDITYDPDTTEAVTYEFEVIDTSGNVSERSSFTVEPGSVPNKVKLGYGYKGPFTYGLSVKDGAIAGVECGSGKTN